MNPTENSSAQIERDCTILLTKPVLSLVEARVGGPDNLLCAIGSNARRSVYYPDGTLLVEAGGCLRKFYQLVIDEQLIASGGVAEPATFTSADPFPLMWYALWHTNEYQERLGDDSFQVWSPQLPSLPPADYQVNDLLITVVFMNAPNSKLRKRFSRFLSDWLSSVSRQGVFGEGGVLASNDKIVFRGTRAQFRLDVSRSGQDTLNWLAVSVLTFGSEVSEVLEIIFGHESQIHMFTGRVRETSESELIE